MCAFSQYQPKPLEQRKIERIVMGWSKPLEAKSDEVGISPNNAREARKDDNRKFTLRVHTRQLHLTAEINLDSVESRSCYQVVRADGIPICIFCKGQVEFADKYMKCADSDARFCLYDCKKKHHATVLAHKLNWNKQYLQPSFLSTSDPQKQLLATICCHANSLTAKWRKDSRDTGRKKFVKRYCDPHLILTNSTTNWRHVTTGPPKKEVTTVPPVQPAMKRLASRPCRYIANAPSVRNALTAQ